MCITSEVPENTIQRDDGWKAFRIQGVLDFSLIGILAKIATILADNGISIFAVSTYNTDYILIKKKTIKRHWKFFRLQDIRLPINRFQFVELRKSKLAQFLNSTQTAISVVPLLVLCWYHRTIK